VPMIDTTVTMTSETFPDLVSSAFSALSLMHRVLRLRR
jgi:hypothetical protein